MTRMRACVVGACAGLLLAGPAFANATDETLPADTSTTTPAPAGPVATSTTVPADPLPPALGPLVVVPAGCATPTAAAVVFEGELTSLSATHARFDVRRVLAGIIAGHERVEGVVDVQYGEEVRFLHVGTRYLVGAGADGSTGSLYSTVRQPAPLFGGDAVVGMNDSDVDCPRLEDPIRTLLSDGSSVDSGVLTPLHGKGSRLLAAVLVPFAVGIGVLVVLVIIKQLLFALGRALRDMGDAPPRPPRRRRHRGASPGGDQAIA